jgi:hypothetical protein
VQLIIFSVSTAYDVGIKSKFITVTTGRINNW